MKKYIIVLVVVFGSVIQTFGQTSLSGYSFVMVPDEYKFLSEKDQFQLNSMTKFLFNKNGFNAFFQSELPNVALCDGLFAEIFEESNIIRTKIFILLRDCNGSVVYESEAGSSKFKEYRKAYQDALRNAFNGLQKLNIKQKEIVVETTNMDSTNQAAVNKGSVKTNESKVPQKMFNQYKFDGVAYLLNKKGEGFTLFKESESAENGLLFLGEILRNEAGYVCVMDGKTYPVTFKATMDLLIYKEENIMKLEFQN